VEEAAMDRTEFETRLLRDPELRLKMEELQTAGETVRDLQERLAIARETMQNMILALDLEGAPLAVLARLVGLSPQRMNSIVREASAKALGVSDEQLTAHVKKTHAKIQAKEEGAAERVPQR